MTTITVTQDHIHRGERARCFWCPVALAALEATGAPMAEVVEGTLYLLDAPWEEGGKVTRAANLPARVDEWVCRYDLYGAEAVKPFAFQVRFRHA
jgi:hypothetical protein